MGHFTFLGTGSSTGVPAIGCHCEVCRSTSSKNKRFRVSGLVRTHGKTFLIDAGPDLRSQALRFGVDHLDGLLLTHTHYDHVAGIDEMRNFNFKHGRNMPCLLSDVSLKELKRRYYYFFEETGSTNAQFDFHIAKRKTHFLGADIGCFFYEQQGMQVTGFRFDTFAYITDLKSYDESVFDDLQGVEVLVLNSLRPEGSSWHLSFEECEQFSKRVGAKRTFLTHLGHFMDHDAMNELLPDNIEVAYDGLEVEF